MEAKPVQKYRSFSRSHFTGFSLVIQLSMALSC